MFYILKDKEIVQVTDVLEWANWMQPAPGSNWEDHPRFLKKTKTKGLLVSTVFIGISVSDQPIQLFETMVYDVDQLYHKKFISPCIRKNTYDEAITSHQFMIDLIDHMVSKD